MEKRIIELSKENAKELYEVGGKPREIALQAYTEQELTFKPITWEEFSKERTSNSVSGWYIYGGKVEYTASGKSPYIQSSKKETDAFLALMKLYQLRKAWIGDWGPNWADERKKWCIVFDEGRIEVQDWASVQQCLSFPTERMAADFVKCFRDLIEVAEILL